MSKKIIVIQVINLPQISQISQILAAHRHAIAQISYGLLRLKSLINKRIQSVKSKIIVAIATLICLICWICGRYKTFESWIKEVKDNTWYTLDGRKLDGKPTKKGLYIVNGKKRVIK